MVANLVAKLRNMACTSCAAKQQAATYLRSLGFTPPSAPEVYAECPYTTEQIQAKVDELEIEIVDAVGRRQRDLAIAIYRMNLVIQNEAYCELFIDTLDEFLQS